MMPTAPRQRISSLLRLAEVQSENTRHKRLRGVVFLADGLPPAVLAGTQAVHVDLVAVIGRPAATADAALGPGLAGDVAQLEQHLLHEVQPLRPVFADLGDHIVPAGEGAADEA